MKAHVAVLPLAVLGLASMPVWSNADLARSKSCLACHSVDKKIIGPAFKDVAARYAGNSGAVDMLAAKIVNGGSGVWGAVPMPANPSVTPQQARQLAEWVLGTK